MQAIVIDQSGGPEVLNLREVADPVPADDEVVITVSAAGVNRADLMQRRGLYPPPPGASAYPGLECSGQVTAVGSAVTGWQIGDEACALLAGGGYAEQVAVPAVQLLGVPQGLSVHDAAALPEVACTVYSNVVMNAGLGSGDTLLVHGGSSGIGTMAIQLASAIGARVVCTAGSAAKLARCRELGADLAINYRDEDFATAVARFTDGRGADVILDIMGASYLSRNIATLAIGGRLVVIGLQGGATGEIDLGQMLRRRLTLHAASLRARPVGEKAAIVSAVVQNVWPLVSSGAIRPIIDTVLPLADASHAHRLMEESGHIGKILLAASGT